MNHQTIIKLQRGECNANKEMDTFSESMWHRVSSSVAGQGARNMTHTQEEHLPHPFRRRQQQHCHRATLTTTEPLVKCLETEWLIGASGDRGFVLHTRLAHLSLCIRSFRAPRLSYVSKFKSIESCSFKQLELFY